MMDIAVEVTRHHPRAFRPRIVYDHPQTIRLDPEPMQTLPTHQRVRSRRASTSSMSLWNQEELDERIGVLNGYDGRIGSFGYDDADDMVDIHQDVEFHSSYMTKPVIMMVQKGRQRGAEDQFAHVRRNGSTQGQGGWYVGGPNPPLYKNYGNEQAKSRRHRRSRHFSESSMCSKA